MANAVVAPGRLPLLGHTLQLLGRRTDFAVLTNLFWYQLSSFFWPHPAVWQLDLAPPLSSTVFTSMRLLDWSRWGQNQLLQWSPNKFAGSRSVRMVWWRRHRLTV